MTSNKVCSYCKQDHGVVGEIVCPVENTGLYSTEKKDYFSLELVSNPITRPAIKFIPPNLEATEYFNSIWGFGGTQNKM